MFNDRDLLAKTLQAEAGNQGLGGMLAVGNVIFNRIDQSNSNLQDVILSPGQFSAWNKYTNYAGGEQGQDMVNLEPSKNAYAAADALLSGNFVDITGGATHYYNPDISQPSWGAQSGGNWKTIGSHLFGKAGSFNEGSQTMAEELTAQDLQNLQQQTLRPQGLMGFLRDPRTRQILSSFSRSRVGQRLGEIADQDRELQIAKDEDNKTARFLMSQPKGVKYARAILEGGLSGSEAYSQFLSETQRAGTKVGDRIIDPVTGDLIYEEKEGLDKLDKDDLAALNTINDDLRARTKLFEEVRDGVQRIKLFYDNPSGTSDYALAVSFAKILDPGSVAREGEVRAVQNAGARLPAINQALINAVTGEGSLTPKVRYEIANLAIASYATQRQAALEAVNDAKRLAKGAGVDEKYLIKVIIPDIPSVQSPPSENAEMPNGPVPSWASQQVTQEQWNKLSEEQVKKLTDKAREEGVI